MKEFFNKNKVAILSFLGGVVSILTYVFLKQSKPLAKSETLDVKIDVKKDEVKAIDEKLKTLKVEDKTPNEVTSYWKNN